MLKKMMLLALAVGALVAFAVPLAQADITLTEETSALAPGAPVTATSEDMITTMGGNQLECELVTLHYKVVTNGSNHVVLDPVGEDNVTAEGCALSVNGGAIKLPELITEADTEQLTIDTWGAAEVGIGFTSSIPAAGLHCTYVGSLQLQATGGSSVELVPSTLSGAPTPPCFSARTVEGNFDLETPDGTPLTLDYTNTG